MSVGRKIQTNSCSLPCTKLKSRWIKDLNIKLDTLNLIEESENSSAYICRGDNFLNSVPMAQALQSIVHKWDLMKLKSFTIGKIFNNSISETGKMYNIYMEL